MSYRQVGLAAIAINALIGAACVPIAAAPIGVLDYGVCGSSLDLIRIANAAVPERSTSAYRALSSGTIRLDRRAQALRVLSVDGNQATIPTPLEAPRTCTTLPPNTQALSTLSNLRGANIAAFDAVTVYRATHPWPLIAAAIDDPGTSVDLQTRGRFLFVILTGPRPARPTFVGCGAVEFYRVDPSTFEVRPFDGCIELHRHVDGLPGIGALPD